MSEEQNQETNDGTWSGLKKTIVGTLGTVVAGGGVWLSTLLFGGGAEETAQPVQPTTPNIIINNTQQQQQQAAPGKTVIIKEKSTEPAPKPAEPAKPKKEFSEEPKW
jgi:hypothetical protein